MSQVRIVPAARSRHMPLMPSVTYQVTLTDAIRAARLHYVRALRTKRAIRSYGIATAIMTVAAAGVAWTDAPRQRPFTFGLVLLMWILALCLILGLRLLLLPRSVRRLFAQNKSLQDEIAAEWSDEGIALRAARGQTTLLWSDFVGIVEDRHSILLLQTDNQYNLIPKRVLTAEQTADIMRHAA